MKHIQGCRQASYVFRQVLQLMWAADKKTTTFLIGINLISGLLTFPTFYLGKIFLDLVTQGAITHNWAAFGPQLIGLACIQFAVYLASDVIGRLSSRCEFVVRNKFSNYVDVLTAQKYSQLELSLVENSDFQDRYNKILRTTNNRIFRIAQTTSLIPNNVGVLISAGSLIALVNPWVMLIVVALSIPAFIVTSRNTKARYELESVTSPLYRLKNRVEFLITDIYGFVEVKLLAVRDFLLRKYINQQQEIYTLNDQYDQKATWSSFSSRVPRMLVNTSFDVYAGFLAITGLASVGTAFTFSRSIGRFDSGFQGLVRNMIDLYENFLYVSDLLWLLQLPVNSMAIGHVVQLPLHKGLELKDVWFRYPGSEKWILKGISFSCSPTDNIALIGENGAGKSTLVKLICRLYEPDKGEILLNGIPIHHYSHESYWRALGVFFQDVTVFGFSAKEEIGFGDIQRLDEEKNIHEAARLAHIHDWIEQQRLGYASPLIKMLQNGINPSGGQRQRIALAKILFRNAPIFILDEPTANVDPEAEEQIFNDLLKLGTNKLLIFISHRFSTVRRADKIFVLHDGKVIEAGSHAQLLRKKGEYAKLFKLQAKNYA